MLGKTEGKRRRGQQRKRWSHSITDSMDMSLSKHWEMVEDRGAWRAAVHGVTKSLTRRRDSTTTIQHITPCLQSLHYVHLTNNNYWEDVVIIPILQIVRLRLQELK